MVRRVADTFESVAREPSSGQDFKNDRMPAMGFLSLGADHDEKKRAKAVKALPGFKCSILLSSSTRSLRATGISDIWPFVYQSIGALGPPVSAKLTCRGKPGPCVSCQSVETETTELNAYR